MRAVCQRQRAVGAVDCTKTGDYYGATTFAFNALLSDVLFGRESAFMQYLEPATSSMRFALGIGDVEQEPSQLFDAFLDSCSFIEGRTFKVKEMVPISRYCEAKLNADGAPPNIVEALSTGLNVPLNMAGPVLIDITCELCGPLSTFIRFLQGRLYGVFTVIPLKGPHPVFDDDCDERTISNRLASSLSHHMGTITGLVLDEINLSNTILIETLSPNISPSRSLTKLNLSRCNLDFQIASIIAATLASNKSITSLSLSNNPLIGDIGTMAITKALKENHTLRFLNLSRCNITDVGFIALSKRMHKSDTFRTLHISGNIDPNFTGFTRLERPLRVCVVGLGGCGKSSLLLRFIEDRFDEAYYETTIVTHNTVTVIDEVAVEMQLTETSGYEELFCIRDQAIKASEAFIFLYDYNSIASFSHIRDLYGHVCQLQGTGDFPKVIVCAKMDKETTGHISDLNEARAFAESIRCPLLTTSAKTGTGIDSVFAELYRLSHKSGYCSVIPTGTPLDFLQMTTTLSSGFF
ncbi:rasG protein [Pelomyxa schiedti]|nr:rasG protein [Pelomyxa schiedti]